MRRLATRVKRSFANLQAQAGAASPPADRPPAQEPDCVARPPVPSDSGLESLPPEVTRQIMALLPLADVKAIVFASPVFYHQYRFDRKYILCRALEQTLGPACREAYAAYQCGAALERIPTVVQEAVQSYSSMSPCHSIYNVSTEEEAVGMASFYLKTVQPVVGYYGRWALDNLSKHTGRHPHYQTVQMTSTEIMRITGAAYRFQILCHVLDNRSPDDTVNTYFTCLEGWEADQVLAFYQFIRRMIKDTFEKIKEDLHPKHARFKDQGPYPSPQEAFQLDRKSPSASPVSTPDPGY
ncbi:hypothetical protein B0I35DRAFT_442037 [Stachybotrys elegans]|uniref:F-box domain-containing protein n=1 Tax=Stachybotrys elegans TaxID=80388 RepID=A0A8K0WLA2_9HYPO|nr:hypothetical protein B0I35DRAFT_442037 [Stachybotrys elegans]